MKTGQESKVNYKETDSKSTIKEVNGKLATDWQYQTFVTKENSCLILRTKMFKHLFRYSLLPSINKVVRR